MVGDPRKSSPMSDIGLSYEGSVIQQRIAPNIRLRKIVRGVLGLGSDEGDESDCVRTI